MDETFPDIDFLRTEEYNYKKITERQVDKMMMNLNLVTRSAVLSGCD